MFDVWMHCPDGRSYKESNYDGYGEFGGKDYFIALSECSYPNPALTQLEHRKRGIVLSYDVPEAEKRTLKFPVFTETPTYNGSFGIENECEMCENQGMGYEDDDPTRVVNQMSHAELKIEYNELDELYENTKHQLQLERKEVKRLRECLSTFTQDEHMLTGKKPRVGSEDQE